MSILVTRVDAIRDHLTIHAHLPAPWNVSVNVHRDEPITVQLQLWGLVDIAAGLLAWASTLTTVTASAWRVDSGHSVHLTVRGELADGTPVKVFDAVDFDPAVFLDLQPGGKQSVGLSVLRAWAASATGVAA